MKIVESIKFFSRRTRAILFPIRDIETHLQNITKSTSRELSINQELIQMLEIDALKTCREMGISSGVDKSTSKNH